MQIDSPVHTPSPPKLPKAGFWAALVIFLVSAIVGIVMIVVSVGSIANTINDFAEIGVPQSAQVQLSSGEYWVFEGTTLNSLAAGLVDVTVTDPNGSSLNLSSDFNQYNASSSGQQFTSLGKLNVPSAGVYTFETEGPSGTTVRVGPAPGRTSGRASTGSGRPRTGRTATGSGCAAARAPCSCAAPSRSCGPGADASSHPGSAAAARRGAVTPCHLSEPKARPLEGAR